MEIILYPKQNLVISVSIHTLLRAFIDINLKIEKYPYYYGNL